jgi:hypothetical protein
MVPGRILPVCLSALDGPANVSLPATKALNPAPTNYSSAIWDTLRPAPDCRNSERPMPSDFPFLAIAAIN